MNTLRNKNSLLAFAALLMGIGINSNVQAQYAQQPQEQNQQDSRAPEGAPSISGPIEGTWIFTITQASTGNFFTALQAFTTGGVTVATGTVDRAQNISPLYGSWKRSGRNRYIYTIAFFVFNEAGTATALIKSNGELRLLDHDKLKGTGTGEACDTNGDNCIAITDPNVITGKRLVPKDPSQ